MQRVSVPNRENPKIPFAEMGFDFHDLPSTDGEKYWREGVAYEFSAKEIDILEDASDELHEMCLSVVEKMIISGDYPAEYFFSDHTKNLIENSWKTHEKGVYGRFDLGYDGENIKLLEYNADTPTSLLEASVVQWQWKEELKLPDQFNSIHEHLVEAWKKIDTKGERIFFCPSQEAGREDWANVEYMMETALEADKKVSLLALEKIGWNGEDFVDLNDKKISFCFKLYPWEWMKEEDFFSHLPSKTTFFEPPWKMILSNKLLLVHLWELFPNHPFLLPSFLEKNAKNFSGKLVKKPILGREGANVSILGETHIQNFSTEYDHSGYIVQEYFPMKNFSGYFPVLGTWMIGDKCFGMGIREDVSFVTTNNAHFVPHFFS